MCVFVSFDHKMLLDRNSALVNALAENGHNITVLSVDTDPDPPKNIHYIHMEGVYDYMYKEIFVDLVGLHNETSMHSVLSLYAFGTVSCIGTKQYYTNVRWEVKD